MVVDILDEILEMFNLGSFSKVIGLAVNRYSL